MDVKVFYDEQKKMKLQVTQSENCEFVNPKKYYFDIRFNISVLSYINTLITTQQIGVIPKKLDDAQEERVFEFFKAQAIKESINECEAIYLQSLPEKVFDIFKNDKKDVHKNAFKNIFLTMNQLLFFYFKAFDEHNCLYSKYLFIIRNKGIDNTKMPDTAIIENDGSVTKFGATSLSDGEIKQAIKYRKCTRVDFLDNNEKWYCFYWTWNAIDGKESSKHFDEHIHYIDYTWGLTRGYVLKQLSSEHYSLKGIHINFEKSINPQ